MAEYIEREAVKEALLGWDYDPSDEDVEYAIDHIPAADVVTVKHGRWVLGYVEPGYCTPGGNRPWICSECGQVISWRLDKPMEKYCPNCGAKMDLEADHEAD